MSNTLRHRVATIRACRSGRTDAAPRLQGLAFQREPLYYGWTGDPLVAEIALFRLSDVSNNASAPILAQGIGLVRTLPWRPWQGNIGQRPPHKS